MPVPSRIGTGCRQGSCFLTKEESRMRKRNWTLFAVLAALAALAALSIGSAGSAAAAGASASGASASGGEQATAARRRGRRGPRGRRGRRGRRARPVLRARRVPLAPALARVARPAAAGRRSSTPPTESARSTTLIAVNDLNFDRPTATAPATSRPSSGPLRQLDDPADEYLRRRAHDDRVQLERRFRHRGRRSTRPAPATPAAAGSTRTRRSWTSSTRNPVGTAGEGEHDASHDGTDELFNSTDCAVIGGYFAALVRVRVATF